ncbi:MAG: prenyltransferase/squalene oxidase repeat-containing protein [Planctomycetales bacterium]
MSQMFSPRSWCRAAAAVVLCFSASLVNAADPPRSRRKAHKAVEFLRTTQQDDGCWTAANNPGLTGLVVTSLLKSGVPASDPMVVRALNFLEKLVQTDGGIYYAKGNHRNYETCIALMAFQAAHQEERYQKILKDAEKYVREQQWDEGEGKDKNDPFYGGAGYGSKSRPDLSNTHFLIDALKAAGASADDPALQKALVFVSRCQNLETQFNTTEFAAKVNDGGFYYTPAAGGSSMAGNDPNGGLRSYASMTYAGLKSMIYAGVNADDPRVKAAVTWIQKHYSITENPGMEGNGLYYYYNTFAKALNALGQDQITDADGKSHDWRAELRTQLLSVQKANGSWVNPTPRWLEGDPNLATAYALMALEYCAPKTASK